MNIRMVFALLLIIPVVGSECKSQETKEEREIKWSVDCGDFGYLAVNLPAGEYSGTWLIAPNQPKSISNSKYADLGFDMGLVPKTFDKSLLEPRSNWPFGNIKPIEYDLSQTGKLVGVPVRGLLGMDYLKDSTLRIEKGGRRVQLSSGVFQDDRQGIVSTKMNYLNQEGKSLGWYTSLRDGIGNNIEPEVSLNSLIDFWMPRTAIEAFGGGLRSQDLAVIKTIESSVRNDDGTVVTTKRTEEHRIWYFREISINGNLYNNIFVCENDTWIMDLGFISRFDSTLPLFQDSRLQMFGEGKLDLDWERIQDISFTATEEGKEVSYVPTLGRYGKILQAGDKLKSIGGVGVQSRSCRQTRSMLSNAFVHGEEIVVERQGIEKCIAFPAASESIVEFMKREFSVSFESKQ